VVEWGRNVVRIVKKPELPLRMHKVKPSSKIGVRPTTGLAGGSA
jgi:hypothetical protein